MNVKRNYSIKRTLTGVYFKDPKTRAFEFIPNENLIECKLCGLYFRAFATHLLREHDTTERDYKRKFNLFFSKGILSPKTLAKVRTAYFRTPEADRLHKYRTVKSKPTRRSKSEFNPISREATSNALTKKSQKTKKHFLSLFRGILETKHRRPRKEDFTDYQYKTLFRTWGSLKNCLKELGLSLPLERPHKRKPIEEIKKNRLEYQREWVKANQDKIQQYKHTQSNKNKMESIIETVKSKID